jgi:hypothetical protein
MENKINEIIKELYEIDKTIIENEDKIYHIIEKMLRSQPKIIINDDFKNELKEKLNKKIIEKKLEQYNKNSKPSFSKIITYVIS